jgi:hypothetical protein
VVNLKVSTLIAGMICVLSFVAVADEAEEESFREAQRMLEKVLEENPELSIQGLVWNTDYLEDGRSSVLYLMEEGRSEIWRKSRHLTKEKRNLVFKTAMDGSMEFMSEYMRQILPLYEEYFEPEEMQELHIFFETPLGRKTAAFFSTVHARKQQIRRQVITLKIEDFTKKVRKKLRDKGIVLPD